MMNTEEKNPKTLHWSTLEDPEKVILLFGITIPKIQDQNVLHLNSSMTA